MILTPPSRFNSSGLASKLDTSGMAAASAAQAADWPRLAEARGSLRHTLAVQEASGEPAGRSFLSLAITICVLRVSNTGLPVDLGDECISNRNVAGVCLFIMIIFSIFVQAAEGLHYGIVPYVSRPALGVVSGMVGAGGSLGSVITLAIFFSGAFRDDSGIVYMGVYILAVTGLLALVYFPEHGSMLFPKGALKNYDPQLIKPPAGYLGADFLDLSNLNVAGKQAASEDATSAKRPTDKHAAPPSPSSSGSSSGSSSPSGSASANA